MTAASIFEALGVLAISFELFISAESGVRSYLSLTVLAWIALQVL